MTLAAQDAKERLAKAWGGNGKAACVALVPLLSACAVPPGRGQQAIDFQPRPNGRVSRTCHRAEGRSISMTVPAVA
jgi:hypothetical protein